MSAIADLIPHSAVQVQLLSPLACEGGQARPQGVAGAAHVVHDLARRNLLILELNVEFQGLEIENIDSRVTQT